MGPSAGYNLGGISAPISAGLRALLNRLVERRLHGRRFFALLIRPNIEMRTEVSVG